MAGLWRTLRLWLTSKAELVRAVKRLERRLEREQEAVACLERQRDTLLDMLDRVRWEARAEAAAYKAMAEGLRDRTEAGP